MLQIFTGYRGSLSASLSITLLVKSDIWAFDFCSHLSDEWSDKMRNHLPTLAINLNIDRDVGKPYVSLCQVNYEPDRRQTNNQLHYCRACQVDRCQGEVLSHFNGILIKTPSFVTTFQSKMLFYVDQVDQYEAAK